MRITAFTTNTPSGQLADLELRHRRRTRAQNRIRAAKDTGLTRPAAARLRPARFGAPSSRWPAHSRKCRARNSMRRNLGPTWRRCSAAGQAGVPPPGNRRRRRLRAGVGGFVGPLR
jgi:hypothetical protein